MCAYKRLPLQGFPNYHSICIVVFYYNILYLKIIFKTVLILTNSLHHNTDPFNCLHVHTHESTNSSIVFFAAYYLSHSRCSEGRNGWCTSLPWWLSCSGEARKHHHSGRSFHRRMMQYSPTLENNERGGSAEIFTTVTVALYHHPEFGSNTPPVPLLPPVDSHELNIWDMGCVSCSVIEQHMDRRNRSGNRQQCTKTTYHLAKSNE